MNKFEVGDKVIRNNDLHNWNYYYPDDYIATVQGVSDEGKNITINGRRWNSEKFEKASSYISSNNIPKKLDSYIINKNATILFWNDGTKRVVKRAKHEPYDKRLGFLYGYFQEMCGMSKNKANKFIDELVEEDK